MGVEAEIPPLGGMLGDAKCSNSNPQCNHFPTFAFGGAEYDGIRAIGNYGAPLVDGNMAMWSRSARRVQERLVWLRSSESLLPVPRHQQARKPPGSALRHVVPFPRFSNIVSPHAILLCLLTFQSFDGSLSEL